MRGILCTTMSFIPLVLAAQQTEVDPLPEVSEISVDLDTRPAEISPEDLNEFATLPDQRRKMIETALTVLRDSPWLPYTIAGSEPNAGGFDCSGAIFFILSKIGIEAPRSSEAQFEWLKSNSRLHTVSPGTTEQTSPEFAKLKPGDLVFWAVSAATPEEPNAVRIHHVAMYLGTEKKDKRPVMINATDGRSYRGQKANGYGVYDFSIPKAESPSKIAGYGTPPGISE
jgi:peptidoglycan DL-endopeptidase CwlO